MVKPFIWDDERGLLKMLDQRLLPGREIWLELRSCEEVVESIKTMAVRGAPAIGIAAAYGMALAAKEGMLKADAIEQLAASRPTAVNLFWAIERISRLHDWSFHEVLAEAKAIEAEDFRMNVAIGHNGAELIPEGANILTICNTGALATGGHGTALGIIRSAQQDGKRIHVYACETRPRQQGLRLTAYELLKENIPFHAIADGAAGYLMQTHRITCVIAGADRIAANGDSANKIGTYSLAVLAKQHGVPFYIAAPSTTLDVKLPNGQHIPIEERHAKELTHMEGNEIAPAGCPVWNPAFDLTPAEFISAIVTEHGVYRAPYAFDRIAALAQ